MSVRTAIIIGAGPAGLTTAYELLTRTDILPIVIEKSDHVGGISRTVNYKGNRIDIGGHRFFSKSDRVMEWWFQHLPMQKMKDASPTITYQQRSRTVNGNGDLDPEHVDRIMLVRQRRSRIYFLRKFFDYPISLTPDTVLKLGAVRIMKIGLSYARRALVPIRNVKNLEQFFINSFGDELYRTFFKSYTEKVWGVPCHEIDAEWGAQRIKGLSVWKTITHFVKKQFQRSSDVRQKGTQTSLIEQFLYPKFGPGQMWEVVSEKVRKLGAEIVMETSVEKLHVEGNRIVAVTVRDKGGTTRRIAGDLFFSTMPVQELMTALDRPAPVEIQQISDGLMYRDFFTVGLLLNSMKVREPDESLITDNWIYIQEPDVFVGRLQIFNNWSPYLVKDGKVWIGAEYFCNQGDALWSRSDGELQELAKSELEKIGMIEGKEVVDATVIRMPKTYPAYFGTYNRFEELRKYIDGFTNLYLLGRNGMHKYNNQDHSMLTAMTAVDNIVAGRIDKENVWSVNTEMEYHESK
jgi:protoporphyrinogen oxidase